MDELGQAKTPSDVIAEFMERQSFERDPQDGSVWCSDSNAGFHPSDLIKALNDAGYAIVPTSTLR